VSAPRKPKAKRPKRAAPASQIQKAERLHQIELLFLADPDLDVSGKVMHLLTTRGLPGDRPLPPRTARWYLAAVRERLLARAAVDREQNRALALRRLDALYQGAASKSRYAEAAAIACRRADFDGSRVATEEAVRPSLCEQVLALRARAVDWSPSPPPKKLPRLSPEQQRFWLERALHLGQQATDSAAAYRELGPPPDDEVERRLWLQKAQAQAVWQGMTGAGVAPDKRREAAHRGGAAYAMLSRDAELADKLEQLRQEIERMKK